MANILSADKQTAAIHALCEGTSIRAIERMTGIHRDTIMRLGVRVGEACAKMHDEKMRELTCTHIQADEIWGFIGKKQKFATNEEQAAGLGDVWTFVGIDPESKLVPSYVVGKRDFKHTYRFVSDLASRMRSRIQLTTDGMIEYRATIAEAFGSDVDYGQIVKVYGAATDQDAARRYSPARITSVRRMAIRGTPDPKEISTSLIERQNLTMRMHMRRLTRLTNGFSKKVENFGAAVALHFAYYNFVRTHGSIRCTPAQQAGISDRAWSVSDLLALA
jgi:IS1 family transposase